MTIDILSIVIALLLSPALGCGNGREQSEQKMQPPSKKEVQSIVHVQDKAPILPKIPGSKGWTATIESKRGHIAGVAASQSNSGQVFATGLFSGEVDFDPSGKEDIRRERANNGGSWTFVTSYDPSGKYLWTRVISSYAYAMPNALDVTSDGGVVVMGDSDWKTALPGEQPVKQYCSHISAVKFSRDGAVDWHIALKGNISLRSGMVDDGDNIWITGAISNSEIVDLDPGPGKKLSREKEGGFFIVRLDKNGNYLAHIRMEKDIRKTARLSNGDLVAVGEFDEDYEGTVDIFDGRYHHKVTTAGKGPWIEDQGRFSKKRNAYLGVYDSSLKLKYEKVLKTFKYSTFDNVIVHDGKMILAGWAECDRDFPIPTEEEKPYLLNMPGKDAFPQNAICQGSKNSYLLTLNADGTFSGVWPFESTSQRTSNISGALDGSFFLDSRQDYELFNLPKGNELFNTQDSGSLLLKAAPDKTFVWSRVIGTEDTYIAEQTGVAAGPDGSVVITGSFQEPADFDPGPNKDERSAKDRALFITKLMPDGYYDH